VRTFASGTGKQAAYATVKGAGHLVPHDKPVQATALFRAFLSGGAWPPMPTPP
jgi:hypothetical protein